MFITLSVFHSTARTGRQRPRAGPVGPADRRRVQEAMLQVEREISGGGQRAQVLAKAAERPAADVTAFE